MTIIDPRSVVDLREKLPGLTNLTDLIIVTR